MWSWDAFLGNSIRGAGVCRERERERETERERERFIKVK